LARPSEILKEPLARDSVVQQVPLDEKAIAKRHQYLTIVADLERSRVLYLADDRKQESLHLLGVPLSEVARP
jgi:hypothetical protein